MPKFISRYFGQRVEQAWLNLLGLLAGVAALFLAVRGTVVCEKVDHLTLIELLAFCATSLGLNEWLTIRRNGNSTGA